MIPHRAVRRRLARTARVAATAAGRAATGRGQATQAGALGPVVEAFQELGATYVKLGQLIGSSPGIFGAAWSTAFRSVLDSGPALPPGAARAEVEAELGRPVERLFESFEDRPLAAASIAVVHRARLPGGEPVAVKVLRPGIGPVVQADVAILGPLVRFLSRQGLEQVAAVHSFLGGLRQQVAEELDLRNEAAAMARFRELFADMGLDRIVVPAVHGSHSGRRVLTMELLDGVAIDDPATVDWGGADPRVLLLQLLKGWFTTAVVDGVFHGDLHAGNMLLLRDGRLGMIDWGILGRLDPATHWLFRRMLEACLGDTAGWRDVAEVYRVMGLSMQDDFGMPDDVAATIARAQLEPILTRPFGRIDLNRLFVTSRDAAGAMRAANGAESPRERWERWRAARRHGRRVVAADLRESPFDRANFMLGKQLLYVERFGKLYLPDVPLLHDRRFVRRLLASPGPPSPLTRGHGSSGPVRPGGGPGVPGPW